MWASSFVRPLVIVLSTYDVSLLCSYQVLSFPFDFSFTCRESMGMRLTPDYKSIRKHDVVLTSPALSHIVF